MYRCAQEFPDNPFVQSSLRHGLSLRALAAKTPDRISAWLIDYYNNFHAGSKTSAVEVIKTVPKVRGYLCS